MSGCAGENAGLACRACNFCPPFRDSEREGKIVTHADSGLSKYSACSKTVRVAALQNSLLMRRTFFESTESRRLVHFVLLSEEDRLAAGKAGGATWVYDRGIDVD